MTRRIIFLIIFGILFLGGRSSQAEEDRKDPFRARFSDEIRRVAPGETFDFTVDFKIPSDHYLYDDKTTLLFQERGDLELIGTQRPPAQDHFDAFFKKNLQVHFKDFTQTVTLRVPPGAAPGRRILEADLRYQGCSDDFCYRPVKKSILLPVEVGGSVAQWRDAKAPSTQAPPPGTQGEAKKKLSFKELLRESNPERLLNQGKVPLLALALAGGVLTSFTPCVLPIIPLTLAFIGVRHRRRGNLLRALTLVAGMVFMYSLLGFFAATLGLKLGFLFQSRVFVLLTSVFFLVFALGLFGVIPFHLPPGLHNKFARMGGEGPLGAFAAGLTMGLLASPCVGPLIAPLLLIAARSQDRVYGFLLLLNYGIGMGLLILLLASGWAELQMKFKAGRWTDLLKKGLGILMLVPALYYGYSYAKPFLNKPVDKMWVSNFEEGLRKGMETGKPILIDFYADWCPPCIELDKRTFSQAEVRQKGEEFIMLKVDCSFDDENCQKATGQYHVVGWPTVLFLRPNGERISELQWVGGFADAPTMLSLMEQALAKSK
jgi:thiol:disulfide interchange protein DsbD